MKLSFSGMYEMLQCCLLAWMSDSLIVLGPTASLMQRKRKRRVKVMVRVKNGKGGEGE